jgi:protein-L-isoaspartate(D-aspartate) O-methyltransferase
MADFALQRKNMVESQVRPSDITDRRITRAMLAVPRDVFAPDTLRSIAYMDDALPMTAPAGRGSRAMASARVLAKLIQTLELGDRPRVLEIGAGTGYAAAVLATIGAEVIALEADSELAAKAKAHCAALKLATVQVIVGAHAAGHAAAAPYDAILIAGSVATVPAALLDQLKDGGTLAAVLANGAAGTATQWRRHGGIFDRRAMFDAGAPVVPGFELKPQFVF